MQAQTILSQSELIKQYVGKWKCEFGKDTVVVSDTKDFGSGALEMYQKWTCKDKVLFEQKMVWGYDKKNDKYICARIKSDGPDMALIVFYFTAPNTCIRIPYENLSNPVLSDQRAVYEFKSVDLMTATFSQKNKKDVTFTWHRVND